MSEHRDEPGPVPRRRIRPVDVWLGVVFFGIGNFVLLLFLLGDVFMPSLFWGAAYALLILSFSALVYFVAEWRGFALGIVTGFVLMTLVSGGACTLFTYDAYLGDDALILYPVAVLIGGVALAIHAVVRGLQARRRRRS